MWLHSPDKCSISKDPGAIAVMLCESCTRIADALHEIQNPHMPLLKDREEKYISGGLKKEAEKQSKRRRSKVRAAKARWGKKIEQEQEQCTRNADASFVQCPPSPSPSPSPATQRRKKTASAFSYSEDFELFWNECPKKRDKAAAYKVWKKVIDSEIVGKQFLVSKMRAYAGDVAGTDFIKYPKTWLNSGSWDDVSDADSCEASKAQKRKAAEAKRISDGVEEFIKDMKINIEGLTDIADIKAEANRLSKMVLAELGKEGQRRFNEKVRAEADVAPF
jgi:hypothetical protein